MFMPVLNISWQCVKTLEEKKAVEYRVAGEGTSVENLMIQDHVSFKVKMRGLVTQRRKSWRHQGKRKIRAEWDGDFARFKENNSRFECANANGSDKFNAFALAGVNEAMPALFNPQPGSPTSQKPFLGHHGITFVRATQSLVYLKSKELKGTLQRPSKVNHRYSWPSSPGQSSRR
jgi:hypothetical protein